MRDLEEVRREKVQWVFCLTAVAELIAGLPVLYGVVEAGEDDVRIEFRMRSSAWEILVLGPADPDHVVVTLSTQLDKMAGSKFSAWMTAGKAALNADLYWAASRPCSEQASELLAALVRIRGTILHGMKY